MPLQVSETLNMLIRRENPTYALVVFKRKSIHSKVIAFCLSFQCYFHTGRKDYVGSYHNLDKKQWYLDSISQPIQ